MATEEPKTQEVKKEEEEEEMPALENQEGPKLNRGERKCRKALTKLGMKPFAGITRVTIKQRNGTVFIIDDPEVIRDGTNGTQFVAFGELKFDDPNKRLQAAEAQKMAAAQAQAAMASAGAAAGGAKPAGAAEAAKDDGPAEDEAGLTPNHINMVMEHTSCTRNEAIKALRESNDDMINAVMLISGN